MSANLVSVAAGAARRKVDGLGGATASGAVSYAAARVARIVLRREPSGDEALRWTSIFASQADAALGRAELAIALLALPEAAQLDPGERLARGYGAVMRRYDVKPPRAVAEWLARLAGEGVSEADMIRIHFVRLHEMGRSGGRHTEPCAAPVDARRPFFALRDHHGMPLVFTVGRNGHLYLFRRTAFGNWSQTDLSAALPMFDPDGSLIECIDIRQGQDGGIAMALAVSARNGAGGCALYATAGLANSLDEAGWVRAFRTMPQRRRGLPEGAAVTAVALGPVLAGAAPLVLVTAATREGEGRWYFNAANPVTLISPLPEGYDAQAIGCYRLPGAWSFTQGGDTGCILSFSSFPDPFNWGVHVDYQGAPRRPSSFLLAPGSVPNVPDVYVAGDGIVVYRGGHTLPQTVAGVRGARLVWSAQDARAEHIAYSDGAGGLWLVSRAVGSAWRQPRAVAESFVATSLCLDGETGGVHAVGVTPGGALMWMRIGLDGEAGGCEEITQSAVWDAEEDAAALGTAA